MPAQVKLPTGEVIEVDMTYTTKTVDDIKTEIEKRYPAYPAALQALFFDVEELVDGGKTLEEIESTKGRRLVMALKPNFTIISVPITLESKEFEEIAEPKRKVSAALSITPDRLKVTCKGSSVGDQEGYTVEDKGIVEGSEIHADVLPEENINLTVKTLNGEILKKLQFSTCQTSGEVKDSLTKIIGLKRENIRLLHKGRQVEDTKTLAAAGIIDGATLYFIERRTD